MAELVYRAASESTLLSPVIRYTVPSHHCVSLFDKRPRPERADDCRLERR
ncbi:hypothetical protein [Streptomyces sp. SYSU K217416]